MQDDLKITDLRSFAAAIRSGSITRGATALGLSQPVVSQRIQRLEKIVGKQLVIRDARGTFATPHGEKLLAYAERILELHDEARSVLEEDHQPFAGKRSIGLLEDLAIAHLPAALADFARLHPGVELEVVVGPAAVLRKRAERGELDLVLGDPDVMPEPTVRWRKSLQLSWACAPSFDLAAAPLPLVLFSPPCRWRQPLLDAVSAHGREWRVAFQSTSMHAVQAALAAGIGIGALLPANVPPTCRCPQAGNSLPPAPTVEIAIARRAGTGTDPALASLDGLLRRAMRGAEPGAARVPSAL
jgi:DNA-binding transcriptional LysR family regulator